MWSTPSMQKFEMAKHKARSRRWCAVLSYGSASEVNHSGADIQVIYTSFTFCWVVNHLSYLQTCSAVLTSITSNWIMRGCGKPVTYGDIDKNTHTNTLTTTVTLIALCRGFNSEDTFSAAVFVQTRLLLDYCMSLANEFVAFHTNWIIETSSLSPYLYTLLKLWCFFRCFCFSVVNLRVVQSGVFFGDSRKFVLVKKISIEFDLQCLSWPSHKPSTVIKR